MERVLLAVDGIKPSRKAFRFALDLCKSLKVNLSVLQVIDSYRYKEYLKKLQNGSERMRRFVEGSMMAATFAEAGEHEIAGQILTQTRRNVSELLSEFKGAGVQHSLTVKSGDPGKEIVSYVNQHRDVVLTIYDGNDAEKVESDSPVAREVPRKIREHVSVPLVVMQA